MSLDQINDYGVGDVNLTSMMETLDRQRRGYQAISLTHYDDDLEPKIAAGSIVEVGGALFKCESDESITGWAGIGNSNDVYVKLVPSGAAVTAAFVTAAPTWSTSKQGWYVGNDRYVGGLYKDSGGDYTIKWLYEPSPWLEKVIAIGDWNMSSTGTETVTVAHGIADHTKIRSIMTIIRRDTDAPDPTYMSKLEMGVSGILSSMAGSVRDFDATNIVLQRLNSAGGFANAWFEDTGYNRGWIYVKYRA